MSLLPPRCTCAEREHACSPPFPAHPEKGGGLGNPGRVVRLGKWGGWFSDHDTVIPYGAPGGRREDEGMQSDYGANS